MSIAQSVRNFFFKEMELSTIIEEATADINNSNVFVVGRDPVINNAKEVTNVATINSGVVVFRKMKGQNQIHGVDLVEWMRQKMNPNMVFLLITEATPTELVMLQASLQLPRKNDTNFVYLNEMTLFNDRENIFDFRAKSVLKVSSALQRSAPVQPFVSVTVPPAQKPFVSSNSGDAMGFTQPAQKQPKETSIFQGLMSYPFAASSSSSSSSSSSTKPAKPSAAHRFSSVFKKP